MSFKSRLKKIKESWGKAQERKDTFGSTVPDGAYIMRVSATLGESASSGRMQIAWLYTIMEGENRGDTVRDYDGLETEDNLFFIQRKLGRLGQEIPDDPLEIESIVEQIEEDGPLVRATVKTKDEFQHVYVNRLLEDSSEEPIASKVSGGHRDDLPSKGRRVADEEEETEEAEVEEEGEEIAEDEEEIDLAEGMEVSFRWRNSPLKGEILNFTEDDTRARVKAGGKVYAVPVERLTPLETEPIQEPEEEVVEEKPKKKKPKPKKGGGRVRRVS